MTKFSKLTGAARTVGAHAKTGAYAAARAGDKVYTAGEKAAMYVEGTTPRAKPVKKSLTKGSVAKSGKTTGNVHVHVNIKSGRAPKAKRRKKKSSRASNPFQGGFL